MCAFKGGSAAASEERFRARKRAGDQSCENRVQRGLFRIQSSAVSEKLEEPLTGKMWSLEDFESYPALLVMFICNHCPFVKHLKKDIVKLADFYMKKGLAVVAISSNSITTHPQDGPKFMAEEAKVFGYPFPYLYDESQDVARDFGAVCTPEFFLFKKDGRRPFELVYHGQFDDSRPSNNMPVTGRDLSLAIDCVLSGQPVSSLQKPRRKEGPFDLCNSPGANADEEAACTLGLSRRHFPLDGVALPQEKIVCLSKILIL
ncbi:hypothetical protein CDL15_Pgr027854 [Punica granatum]|uniref:Thioredoxin domain-containing protein n=1 Tax=Punica granatum TaxID=22663 RepID=A0A218XJD6_PUNGR|nr:hypothetical protein CDL15_Pgr027854 [Punica granatum]